MNEKNEMNIHEKLTRMQNELLRIPMQKSGENRFGGFSYYELDDILPSVTVLCEKYECTLFFNFPLNADGMCKKGELHLINWSNIDDCLIIEVPFPELTNLPKMNNAQVTGTYQTYLKRYLLLNTFNIVEDEVIDASNPNDLVSTNESKKTVKKEKTSNSSKPKCLDKVIKKCHEEYSEEECDAKLLNKVSMSMLKNKEITREERKEIYEYLKNM